MPYCPSCKKTYSDGQYCPDDGIRLLPDDQAGTEGKARDELIGKVVADRFRVVSKLGQGGMGTVYEAEHRYIKKRVALKLLRAEITEKPDALARFQREALAASTIGHENIVSIDDFGRLTDGQVYLTMELLDGQPLNQLLLRGPLRMEHLFNITIQTCHGLAAAHSKGIVHRDMKPENIFLLERDGDGLKVKILDFGIAKVTRADTNTNLTKTGAIFGTPNYMAPEQALGKNVDHRADVYAMGVILYEMLTGQVPFKSDSFLAILTQHVTRDPTPPSKLVQGRVIPEGLEALILRAMAKQPDDRFQNMGEMLGKLLQVRHRELGDQPMASYLGLSNIQPPSSQAPTTDELPKPITGPGQPEPGKVTATAGELVEALSPPKRRTGLIIGLMVAAVLLGGGGVLAYLELRPSPSPPPPTPTTPVTPAKATRPPDAKPVVLTKKQREERIERLGKVMLVVMSRPGGAVITVNGKPAGKTPDFVEVDPGKMVRLELSRAGYKTHKELIETKVGQRKIRRLVRLKRIKPRKRRTKKRPDPPPVKRPPTRRTSDHDHDHGSSSHGSSNDDVVDGH